MNQQQLILWIVIGSVVVLAIQLWIATEIARVAQRKGKSWAAFFWLSFLVNWLIMLIVVVTLPEVNGSSGIRAKGDHSGSDLGSTQVQCQFCKESVRADAEACKHCGRDITPQVDRLVLEQAKAAELAKEEATALANEKEAESVALEPLRKKRKKIILLTGAGIAAGLVILVLLIGALPKQNRLQAVLDKCGVTSDYVFSDDKKTLILKDTMGYKTQACVATALDPGLALKVYGKTGTNSGTWSFLLSEVPTDPNSKKIAYSASWTSTATNKAEIKITSH